MKQICSKCGQEFKSRNALDTLCRSCKKTIPVCAACGCCIGPNFLEKEAFSCGNKIICGGCKETLERRKRLVISENTFLLPNGSITESPKAL
jgi:hypothetical protein